MKKQSLEWPRFRAGLTGALALWGASLTSQALSPIDYAVRLYAQVTESPPSIALNWASNSVATRYDVYRRPFGAGPWVPMATNLAASASSYLDTNVAVGVAYEYWVYVGPGRAG
jgi:hypothetical protein